MSDSCIFLDKKIFSEDIPSVLNYVRPGNWGINRISSGKTNNIFLCENSGYSLIFKIFGKNTERIIDRKEELKNIKILIKENLHPELRVVFLNGLAVEYLEGTEIVEMGKYRREIMEKMVEWHKVEVEGEAVLFRKMETWLKLAGDKAKELEEWIYEKKRRLENRPVAFCHNDLLESNILTNKGKVYFIDCEYAGCNFIAYDIANHLVEYSGYGNDYEKIPVDEIEDVAKLYIELDEKLSGGLVKGKYSSYLELAKDIREFIPISHVFWGLWALVKEKDREFNYEAYGLSKIEEGLRIDKKQSKFI